MAENNDKQTLEFTEKFDKIKQFADAYDKILQLVDLETNTAKTWITFNKDSLRGYLQNPYSTSSQESLRNLSKFLYTLSFPLRRIVHYFASLPDFSTYKINLDFSLLEENDEESLKRD